MLTTAPARIRSRNALITDWYEKVFPKACTYLHRKGASLETAKELFQQAIVCYYEKMVSDHFEPKWSDEAYLMGIVKKLWLRQCAKSHRTEDLGSLDFMDEQAPEPATLKLLAYLKNAGEKCMDLLQSYYFEKLDMKQLSERFGFKSERSTTVQKFKCLEKVRHSVQQKALVYEDFLD